MYDEYAREKRLASKFNFRSRIVADTLRFERKFSVNLLTAINRRIKDKVLLANVYHRTCIELNRTQKMEMSVSPHEDLFLRKLQYRNRLKIERQVWIGNLCVDLFFPTVRVPKKENLKGNSFRGVAFEVDGDCHLGHVKSKKDQFKEKYLENSGICLMRITNDKVLEWNQATRILNLERFSTLDSRAVRSLWARIHLATVLSHASAEDIRSLFPEKLSRKMGGLK